MVSKFFKFTVAVCIIVFTLFQSSTFVGMVETLAFSFKSDDISISEVIDSVNTNIGGYKTQIDDFFENDDIKQAQEVFNSFASQNENKTSIIELINNNEEP